MRRKPEIFGEVTTGGGADSERLQALDFEIRAPLNTISILTGYLLETCRATERDYLKTIKGACHEILEALKTHVGDDSVPHSSHQPQSHQVQTPTPSEVKRPVTLSGKRILIVEDHQTNRVLLAQILQSAGAVVTAVESGEEAVTAVQTSAPFNLVLMDVHLPGISGFEATKKLRRDSKSAAVPIVAMTALSLKGDKERCLEAGMDAYLPKPVNRGELFTLIAELAT